ncbi:MAG: amidohydrolase [Firmicutes bacterium]|nr:amidohydrolase [Bacillota bacterium]
MSDLIIRGAAILPMDGTGRVIDRGEITIRNGRIVKVEPLRAVASNHHAPAGGGDEFKPEVIEASGHLVIPGLINAHTHAAMTLFRGYADDLPLKTWLEERIWPIEARFEAEDVYFGTMLAIAEMIRGGVTAFADMYFFMEQAAQAVVESGIRASLSRGLIGILPGAEKALRESRELVDRWRGAGGGRVDVMLGPHAPYTCPPDFLRKVGEEARRIGCGIHIHLSETRFEVEESFRIHGCSPVQVVRAAGLLDAHGGPEPMTAETAAHDGEGARPFPFLAAHCVHVSGEDCSILGRSGAAVAHNPGSNLKLGSGIAPVPMLLREGVTVALGTDGAASNNNLDLLEEARLAALLPKGIAEDPTLVPAYQALEMATGAGARALGWEGRVGRIEPGYRADLVLFDLEQSHLTPVHDLVAHLVYAARAGDVRTVIIDGKVVMRDREILTFDETEVRREAALRARRLAGT